MLLTLEYKKNWCKDYRKSVYVNGNFVENVLYTRSIWTFH